jgi:hypothetical protein
MHYQQTPLKRWHILLFFFSPIVLHVASDMWQLRHRLDNITVMRSALSISRHS